MKHTSITTARRTRSLVAVSAAVLLLPGLLAACSGEAPEAEETSRSMSGSGVSLTSCMRDKGYDMDDPSSNSGTLSIAAPDGVDTEQWKKDLQTCMGDGNGAGDGGLQAAKPMPGAEKELEAFTTCVRDRGFSDFPDGQDAQMRYEADDQEAFVDVRTECVEEAFGAGAGAGAGGTVVEQ